MERGSSKQALLSARSCIGSAVAPQMSTVFSLLSSTTLLYPLNIESALKSVYLVCGKLCNGRRHSRYHEVYIFLNSIVIRVV